MCCLCRYALFVVRRLMTVDCWSMSVVCCCLLFVVCCLLFVDFVGDYLRCSLSLSLVCCLLDVGCCLKVLFVLRFGVWV